MHGDNKKKMMDKMQYNLKHKKEKKYTKKTQQSDKQTKLNP